MTGGFLILNFFGNYVISAAVVTTLYILYKVLMLKLVYNFKVHTELQLLHFSNQANADLERDSY